jgi:chromosome segregation ATPase
LANFHQIVAEKDEHIASLQNEFDATKALLSKAAEEEKSLRGQITDLQASLHAAQAQLTESTESLRETKRRLSDLQSTFHTAVKKESTNTAVNSNAEATEELRALLSASRESTSMATEEARVLKEELAVSKTSLSLAKSRLEKERLKHAGELLVSQQLRDLLERVEKELASAQAFILETEYEILALNREHEEQRRELEGNLQEIKESLVAAEEEKFLLSQRIEEATHNTKIAKLESDAALAEVKEVSERSFSNRIA